MNYKIGVDVGGTNTDTVIVDESGRVIGKKKVPTTKKVESGIKASLEGVIDQAKIDPKRIKFAMLGTTHCTNAIIERKNLIKVGVIRIGAPATHAVPPFKGWPDDLADAVNGGSAIVGGGHEYDGKRIAELDEAAIYSILEAWKGRVDSIAISSVFSLVDQHDEQRAGEIVRSVLGEAVPVSLSSELGSIGLLERENATIINASLIRVAREMVHGFIGALEGSGINAKIFFGQNDGTLMTADYALKYPVLTVASGPTNSIRGASYLANIKDALVIDVGGTTTDIGVLSKGFPRESSMVTQIGGIRTNSRMPDLLSIGLGGGTLVRREQEAIFIGPESVGHLIDRESLVFGGKQITVTDISVAHHQTVIGNKDNVRHLETGFVNRSYEKITRMVEEGIDKIKTSAESIPAILVGGGSVLLPDRLQGISEVIRPENFEVANAIGVSIANVSGNSEKVYSLDSISREEALLKAKELAYAGAEKAGADREFTEVVDIEEIPLAYLPGNATKIKVKVVGPLVL